METSTETTQVNDSNSEGSNSGETAEVSILGSLKSEDAPKELGAEPEQQPETKEPEPEAPKEYEAFKLPDDVSLDPAKLESFQELARTSNLTQDVAQQVLDFGIGLVKQATDATVNEFKNQVDNWKQETLKMLGSESEKELSFAAKALSSLLGSESESVKKDLDDLGFGNHPALIKILVSAGKQLSEDRTIKGSNGTPDRELKDRLFSS